MRWIKNYNIESKQNLFWLGCFLLPSFCRSRTTRSSLSYHLALDSTTGGISPGLCIILTHNYTVFKPQWFKQINNFKFFSLEVKTQWLLFQSCWIFMAYGLTCTIFFSYDIKVKSAAKIWPLCRRKYLADSVGGTLSFYL